MPELEEEPLIEITSPDSSVSLTPYILSPISSETSLSHGSDADIDFTSNFDWYFFSSYLDIQLPLEPTIREILIRAANTCELNTIKTIKLQVISIETSLQHMSVHLPLLTELILDGSIISSLRDLGCGLKKLKILHVARCTLTSLDGMFGLDTLEEFYAEDNKITDLSPCGFLPDIRVINLRGNMLKDVMTVTFLAICSDLEHLTLSDNTAITECVEYRQIIKSFLPNLKTLDGEDMSLEKTIPKYLKYSEMYNQLATCDNEEELEEVQTVTECTKRRSTKEENGQFVVSFAPKVLSPRLGSENVGDSNITTTYTIEDINNNY